MKYIPCTIDTFRDRGEDYWQISVPHEQAAEAALEFAELLTGERKRVVFLHRKTELIVTADTAAYNGRQIPITRDFLECLEKLFSDEVRPTRSHLDCDFSDKHGNICITVLIAP